MIDAQPSHGYELIKALETRSNGFYSPSPGMVYPALTYLEELGYVTVQLEGNRKRYELSEAGREYLATNRDRVELMLAKLCHIARKMDSVRRAFAGEEPADISEGGWLPELSEARRALKHALLRRDNVPAAEQRRIAAILMRAAKEIESEGKPGSDKAATRQRADRLRNALSHTRVRRRPCALSNANQTDRSGTLMLTNDNRADLAVHRVRHPLKFRLLQVKQVHALNPHLIRVTFTGEDLHDFVSASFDDHIKVFFPEPGADKPVLPEAGPDGPVFPAGQPRPIARDFTPRRFDAKRANWTSSSRCTRPARLQRGRRRPKWASISVSAARAARS